MTLRAKTCAAGWGEQYAPRMTPDFPTNAANDESSLWGCPICQWRGSERPDEASCPRCGALVGRIVGTVLKPAEGGEQM